MYWSELYNRIYPSELTVKRIRHEGVSLWSGSAVFHKIQPLLIWPSWWMPGTKSSSLLATYIVCPMEISKILLTSLTLPRLALSRIKTAVGTKASCSINSGTNGVSWVISTISPVPPAPDHLGYCSPTQKLLICLALSASQRANGTYFLDTNFSSRGLWLPFLSNCLIAL